MIDAHNLQQWCTDNKMNIHLGDPCWVKSKGPGNSEAFWEIVDQQGYGTLFESFQDMLDAINGGTL